MKAAPDPKKLRHVFAPAEGIVVDIKVRQGENVAAGQHLLTQSGAHDASGNPVLGDITTLLRDSITRYFKEKKRAVSMKLIDPSYIIRSVPANPNDRVYCGFLGQYAVHAAMAGKTNMVVAKVMDRYVHLPLELVTSARRRLKISSPYWRAVLESTGQSHLEGMYPLES